MKLNRSIPKFPSMVAISCFSVLILALALLFWGCGKAPVAVAPKAFLEAAKLESFPPSPGVLSLKGCKFFLWQDEDKMTPEQASRAKAISEEMSDLEQEAIPLNDRYVEIQKSKASLEDEKLSIRMRLSEIKKESYSRTKEKKELEAKLKNHKEKLLLEKGKSEPNVEQIKLLSQEIERLSKDIQGLQDRLASLEAQKDSIQKQLDQMDIKLGSYEKDLEEVGAKKNIVQEINQKKLDELSTLVDYYSSGPKDVTLTFGETGTLQIQVSSWSVANDIGVRTYSSISEDGLAPSIQNVTYTELGGKITFDLYVWNDAVKQDSLSESFHISFSRTKYHAKDGRFHFSGDMTRSRHVNNKELKRKGMIILTDRSN